MREYQKSFPALATVERNWTVCRARQPLPDSTWAVSISRDYTPSSRNLIVSFVKSRCGSHGLAAHVKPRFQFTNQKPGHCDPRNFSSLLSDLISNPTIRRYPFCCGIIWNLGGQVLDFRMDKNFSNVMDGLVVLDLAKVSRRQLERYMGPANTDSFLREHLARTDTAA